MEQTQTKEEQQKNAGKERGIFERIIKGLKQAKKNNRLGYMYASISGEEVIPECVLKDLESEGFPCQIDKDEQCGLIYLWDF